MPSVRIHGTCSAGLFEITDPEGPVNQLKPFRYFLRVRYGECDQQGVVYNARYGEYVDLACSEFLRVALAPRDIFAGGFEVQVVKLLIEWTAPARCDDTLEISVATKAMGNTSFTLGFELRRLGETTPLATAETINVHVDATHWTKTPLPSEIRVRLEAGAGDQYVDHAGVFSPKRT